MTRFTMNGIVWNVYFVRYDSPYLVDRTGVRTLATTDPKYYSVYISNKLYGNKLKHVLIHELGHCVLVSYDLIRYIHRMVKPKYWIEAEERICNLIADYGESIFDKTNSILHTTYKMSKLVS